jgi:lysozyme
MKISDKGLGFLKQLEGCKLQSYRDTGGVLTIGTGHTENVTAGQIITRVEADQFLAQDLIRFENCISNAVKSDLLQHEFDALMCLAFNIGPFAFKYSTLVKYLNAGDFPKAAEEFKRWSYVNHKLVQGLYDRRRKERELFVTGNYEL